MIIKRYDYLTPWGEAAIVLRYLRCAKLYLLICQRNYKDIWTEPYSDYSLADAAFQQERILRS